MKKVGLPLRPRERARATRVVAKKRAMEVGEVHQANKARRSAKFDREDKASGDHVARRRRSVSPTSIQMKMMTLFFFSVSEQGTREAFAIQE